MTTLNRPTPRPGRTSPRWLIAAVLVSLLAVASIADAGPAQAASRVILRPRPAARIRANKVQIVVRAGPDGNDLTARLNGVNIGRLFVWRGRDRWVLDASVSRGLRPGRNLLQVAARWRGRVWNAVVRFQVVRRYLLGAGRTIYVPVGMVRHIGGTLVGAGKQGSRARSRWTLVAAPLNSHYARRARMRAVAGGGSLGPRSHLSLPLGSLGASLPTQGGAATPTVALRPDAPGIYRLRLTTSVGHKTLSDNVRVYALPRSPVFDLNTNPSGKAGIQLGNTYYAAPPMAGTTSNPSWSGDGYQALWQVLAVNRTTLVPMWNRTYGACGNQICRIGSNGKPEAVNAQQELQDLGAGTLVIAASHSGPGWGSPNTLNFATSTLTAIGFPSSINLGYPVNVGKLGPGTAAAIGVPGLTPGQAQIDVSPTHGADMVGYLSLQTLHDDATQNYAFMPASRENFDTRSEATCSGGSGGTCTIAQTLGGKTVSATIPNGQGGYEVTGWNEHNLSFEGLGTFITTTKYSPANDALAAMSDAINAYNQDGALVMVSSLRTPGLGSAPLVNPAEPVAVMPAVAKAIASIGGTQDAFNRSMGNSSDSYSLLGWSGAGQANGTEVTDTTGRLRGALAPDTQSLFRPHNVSSVAQPSEQLAQLVLREPHTSWPLDNDPGAHAALDWIGSQVPELGDSPREAFWSQIISQSTANTIHGEVEAKTFKSSPGSFNGVTFTQAQFDTARTELAQEVHWVGKVRNFLSLLQEPTTQAGDNAWAQAQTLQGDLEQQLSNLQSKAQLSYDWFGIAEALGNLVAPGFDEELENTISAFAAMTDFADSIYQGANGAPGSAQDRRVAADNLATHIQNQAQNTADEYQRMGDMIVSDPSKLAELGHWAQCNPNDNGCDNGKYDGYSLTQSAQDDDGIAATQAVKRQLYEQLVPLAFPVWDTGSTAIAPDDVGTEVDEYSCFANINNPFLGSRTAARWASLQHVDPSEPGVSNANGYNDWRVYLMVARSGLDYAWPSSTILSEMFDPPSQTDLGQGGLGIRPADVMLHPSAVYQPPGGIDCGWEHPPLSTSP